MEIWYDRDKGSNRDEMVLDIMMGKRRGCAARDLIYRCNAQVFGRKSAKFGRDT